jgi:hypothetical protein
MTIERRVAARNGEALETPRLAPNTRTRNGPSSRFTLTLIPYRCSPPLPALCATSAVARCKRTFLQPCGTLARGGSGQPALSRADHLLPRHRRASSADDPQAVRRARSHSIAASLGGARLERDRVRSGGVELKEPRGRPPKGRCTSLASGSQRDRLDGDRGERGLGTRPSPRVAFNSQVGGRDRGSC